MLHSIRGENAWIAGKTVWSLDNACHTWAISAMGSPHEEMLYQVSSTFPIPKVWYSKVSWGWLVYAAFRVLVRVRFRIRVSIMDFSEQETFRILTHNCASQDSPNEKYGIQLFCYLTNFAKTSLVNHQFDEIRHSHRNHHKPWIYKCHF